MNIDKHTDVINQNKEASQVNEKFVDIFKTFESISSENRNSFCELLEYTYSNMNDKR